MGLVKAFITNEERHEKALECLFNPTEYVVAKTSNWQKRPNQGKNVPVYDFGGGDGRTLTMELFFDTAEVPNRNPEDRRNGDVRIYVDALWDLTLIDPSLKDDVTQTGRPPRVGFSWGPHWSFKAVITSLSVRYTLFREDGTPVRATANVTFQEAEDPKNQPGTNPTSQSEPGFRRREIQPQDTLARISWEEYGDSTQWRRIADANPTLLDPLRLPAGQILAIPPHG